MKQVGSIVIFVFIIGLIIFYFLKGKEQYHDLIPMRNKFVSAIDRMLESSNFIDSLTNIDSLSGYGYYSIMYPPENPSISYPFLKIEQYAFHCDSSYSWKDSLHPLDSYWNITYFLRKSTFSVYGIYGPGDWDSLDMTKLDMEVNSIIIIKKRIYWSDEYIGEDGYRRILSSHKWDVWVIDPHLKRVTAAVSFTPPPLKSAYQDHPSYDDGNVDFLAHDWLVNLPVRNPN